MNPNWNQGGYQQPQQTGYQQPLYGQPTGWQQPQQQPQQQQQRPPPPPIPSASYSFLSAPPTQSQFPGGGMGISPQATGWSQPGQKGGLQPQATGWAGAGMGGGAMLQAQRTGFQAPLVAQATGFHDPRIQMMTSSFMPQNISSPYASSGMPVFQQPNLPASNLSSSMNLLNQNQAIATPKIPWVLTKDEKKNYDQIFRAWDQSGSGFISGEVAQEVFGQSGLSRDDMAKIWTLADMDNRGKLNIQEFHVAMGLIYRSLNGNSIPDVLPAELVPASARDLDSNVDFLKNLLKNDTNTRSTSGDEFGAPSYAKSRSFNNSPVANSRKDGTVYKHDEDRGGAKTYKSSSRHLDRASVRTGAESAADDLSDIKRQLESTSSLLDSRISDADARTEEDEALDREMEDLRYRVRRVREDIDHVSKGRRSSEKDEERRKLERELLFLSHEKLPDLEKRIEERDERKRRDERDGVKARDRRNDRYGGRYGDDDREDRYGRDREREREDPDKGYLRGTFERERSRSRDRDDRSRDRDYRSSNDRYGSSSDRDRDRLARSPPPAPAPPAHSLAAPPPPPPASAPSPAPASKNLTPEQRREEARAKAKQKIEDRMRALGLAPTPSEDTVDNSVQERLEREKKEAEEQSKKAEADRAEKENARKARLEGERADRGEPPKPTLPTTAPSAPAPSPIKSALKSAPPPPQPRSALKKPAPPPSKPHAPAAPAPVVASEPEVDPEEERLKEREARLKKAAADRAARMAEIERQEEEERLAEEQFNARRSAFANKSAAAAAAATPTPPSVQSPPAPEVVSPPVTTTGKHNPFNRIGGAAGTPTAASTSSQSTPAGSSNPFFKPTPPAAAEPAPAPVKAPTPIVAPVARAPPKKSAYVAPPEEDWDVIEDKGNDSDSDSDYDTAKNRRNELARALFGGIIPAASPSSSPAPPSTTTSPAPAAAAAPARVNPMLAALGGGSADAPSRGSLFASIQGGAKLKKAVTKESKGVAGNVIGDAAPPSHISDVPRAISPPPSPPAPTVSVSPPPKEKEEDAPESNPNRQSVDWYQGLAANGGVSHPSEAPALSSQIEEAEEEDEKPIDPLDAVDLSKSLKVRTLYTYEGQRPEDLAFLENQMVDAHPAKDPSSPWIYGTLLKDRRSGWFPSSYVVEISTIVQAKALYSYEGTTAEELPFTEGDILTIVDQEDDAWWKAVNDGVVFLVPASYLEISG